MQKIILIVVTIAVLVAILGWYFVGNRAVAPAQPSQNTPAPQEDSQAKEQNSMISSIKDAMGLGKPLVCTYSDVTTGTATTVFVEGKKMKITTTVNGATLYMLFDGTTQYAWSGTEKTGMKMDASCMEEMEKLSKSLPSNSESTAPNQDLESYQDLNNVSCAPAEEESFALPTDVTFTDQCAMLRESMKAIEQMKDQVPATMNTPMQL
ncbi:MAG: hypothetical protein KBD27_03110 [Candidatus Moranbacteria bacterium]|nr:hypothetical protein [Candidatus Moranbacteria bacterium]